MAKKSKKFDYRQYYKDYFGIDFGPDMEVHHIDFDRSNNDIENLLLMPAKLHSQYHMRISQLGGAGSGMINPDMRISSNTYRTQALIGLGNVFDEVMEWVHIKGVMRQMKDSGMKWSDVNK